MLGGLCETGDSRTAAPRLSASLGSLVLVDVFILRLRRHHGQEEQAEKVDNSGEEGPEGERLLLHQAALVHVALFVGRRWTHR